MTDLLLPRTDGGVFAQLIIVTALFATVTWTLRSHYELRLLAIGLWIASYGAMGIRALH